MIIQFILEDSFFDCNLKIKDLQGERDYCINSTHKENMQFNYLDVEVYGTDFDLTIIPKVPDYQKDNKEQTKRLFDKFVKKAITKLFSISMDIMLQVGCTYKIKGLSDGDVVNLKCEQYVVDIFDRYDLLGLIPVVYAFYEVSHKGKRFELINAFGVNRKEVIKTVRGLLLVNFGLGLIFTYPIQIIRLKYLTKDRKVNKFLTKFNRMDDKRRQKLIDKQNKFLD